MTYRGKILLAVCALSLLPCVAFSVFIGMNLWRDRVGAILDESAGLLRVDAESVDRLYTSGMQKIMFVNTNELIQNYLEEGDFKALLDSFTAISDLKVLIDALMGNYAKESLAIYPLDEEIFSGGYVQRLDRLRAKLDAGTEGGAVSQRVLGIAPSEFLWLYVPDADAARGGSSGAMNCYKKLLSISRALAVTEFSVRVDDIMADLSAGYPPGTRIAYRPDVGGAVAAVVSIEQGVDKGAREGAEPVAAETWASLDAGAYYPLTATLNTSGGSFTAYVSKAYVRESLRGFLWTLVLGVAAINALLVLTIRTVTYFMTQRLSTFIDRVNEDVRIVSRGRHFRVGRPPDDDLSRMEAKVYDMVNRMQEYYRKSMDYEHEKKTYELELLQSLINPHFLYNTLSTLRWDCKNEKMENTIEAMVRYYRLALSKGSSIIPLESEMRLAEEYFKIQRYTYRSAFTYDIQMDEGVKGFPMIKNILQPVVENAFLHGIMGLKSAVGNIVVRAERAPGGVALSVADNGLGMTAEESERLLAGEARGKLGGYGFANVLKRLQLFYGAGANVAIESAPGAGTTIRIYIPDKIAGDSALETADETMNRIAASP